MQNLTLKKAVHIILILFILGMLTGIVFGFHMSKDVLVQLLTANTTLTNRAIASPFQLYVHIVSHNLVVSSLPILTFFLFGLSSILHILVGGYVMGLDLVYTIRVHDITFFFAGILPHGVLEFPAIVLSDALGLYLGLSFWKKVFGKKYTEFRAAAKKSWQLFLKVIVPLFLLAGLIEAFVTPRLVLYVEQREGRLDTICHSPKQTTDSLSLLRAYGYCKEH